MTLDPCPFESFKTTLRCDLTGRGPRCYRFVHADPDKRLLAFFDLDDKKFSLDRQLVVKTYDELMSLPDDAMEVVPDPYHPMAIESPVSGEIHTQRAEHLEEASEGNVAGSWASRWNKIKGLVSRDHIKWALLGEHSITDLYVDPVWRHRLIDDVIAGTSTSRYQIERVLGIFLRYGGYDGLRPRTQNCGRPGYARWQLEVARKPGRSNAEQRRYGRAQRPGVNRVDAFWIGRLRMAIDGMIEHYKKDAPGVIRDSKEFLSYFYAHCCWQATLGDRTRIPMDVKAIPRDRALIYHRDALLLEYPTLKKLDSDLADVRGGSAKDLTFGALDISDMDGAQFPEVCLVLADDESKTVSPENCRFCGLPTVLLGVCRKSTAYVGWLVSAGEECTEQYRHLLYNMLTPKDERLRQLGMDPSQLPGIVTGRFDGVVMDRGPGAAHRMLDWTVDKINVDVRLTRAAAPRDKGGVEGGIGLFKSSMRADGILRAIGPMGDLMGARILDRLRALPAGVITLKSIQLAGLRKCSKRKSNERLLITPKAFEIIVIEVINKLNLRRVKKPTALDETMFLAHVKPTPASMLAEHQKLRRGNAALARPAVDLLASILEAKYCTVRRGTIKVGQLFYGSPSSVPEGEEGAQALLDYARDLVDMRVAPKKAKVKVFVKPYKNFVWWQRGDGDWVLLAPVEESAAHCNADRDRIEVLAFEDSWFMDEEDARLKTMNAAIGAPLRKKSSPLRADGLAELRNIHDAQMQAWHGPAENDRAARKELQRREREQRSNLAAAAAGVPAFPAAHAPNEEYGARQRDDRSLEEYFDSDA
jgi:hypothetical protein